VVGEGVEGLALGSCNRAALSLDEMSVPSLGTQSRDTPWTQTPTDDGQASHNRTSTAQQICRSAALFAAHHMNRPRIRGFGAGSRGAPSALRSAESGPGPGLAKSPTATG
jgi:hypothetical protein